MSNRDKELKQAFLELFSIKLRETSPTYFAKKRDPLVEDMSFSEEELQELELNVKNALIKGREENQNENSET
jgi:hypothetical protein